LYGKKTRSRKVDGEAAAVLALQALSFLAGEPARLDRFLRLTGVTIDRLKTDADAASAQTAVLDYLLADESLLLAFAANAAIAPREIAAARSVLAGRERE